MIWLPDYMMAAVDADETIVAADGNTYVAKFDKDKVNTAEGAPSIKEQPVWQIKKIAKYTEGGNTCYRTEYPNGSKLFVHKLSEYGTLVYNYASN